MGTPGWAGPLTTSLRGLWVSGYLPLASRRESDFGNCHATDKSTIKPASVQKRAGAQRPYCAKGRDPRTPASWRHFAVAATASTQLTDGCGRSTYVLALFVCGHHSIHRQCAELPSCPSAAWCPPSYFSEDRRVPTDAVLGQVDDIRRCSTTGAWL